MNTIIFKVVGEGGGVTIEKDPAGFYVIKKSEISYFDDIPEEEIEKPPTLKNKEAVIAEILKNTRWLRLMPRVVHDEIFGELFKHVKENEDSITINEWKMLRKNQNPRQL